MSTNNINNIGAETSFILTRDEITNYEVAASEVEYLLGAAGDIFDMLQSGISLGHFDPESSGVISMMEMVGRGFSAAAAKEGVTMTRLSAMLRDADISEEAKNAS